MPFFLLRSFCIFYRRPDHLLALLALLLALGLPARAQVTAPEQFRFEHLTVEQGLLHSDAMCLARGPNGFMWIGTNRGINRYDGYQRKTGRVIPIVVLEPR